MIQGLDWVREHYEAPAVVVMALGGEAQYALDLAVHDLARAGVSVLVAAGNEDTDACTKSPARCLSKNTGLLRVWGRAGGASVLSWPATRTPMRAPSRRRGACGFRVVRVPGRAGGVSVLFAAGNEDTDACTKLPARRVSFQGFEGFGAGLGRVRAGRGQQQGHRCVHQVAGQARVILGLLGLWAGQVACPCWSPPATSTPTRAPSRRPGACQARGREGLGQVGGRVRAGRRWQRGHRRVHQVAGKVRVILGFLGVWGRAGGVSVLVAAGNESTDACTKSPVRCV